MIELRNVNKYYRTESVETQALSNINLSIGSGDFVAIMGPSGCGKSTLLNTLGMLDGISNGDYIFDSESVGQLPEHKLSKARLGKIGFIFQSFHLIDELSVEENIEVPLLYSNVNRSDRKKRVHAVMEQVNIAHRAKHFPKQLSGGQQQRVAIARALVTQPKVILADEPTGNLDSKHGDEVMHLLESLNATGTTIVMVTHSEHHASFAKRTIHLFDGAVLQKEMIEGSQTERAEEI